MVLRHGTVRTDRLPAGRGIRQPRGRDLVRGRCAVDWDDHGTDSAYDLSRFVRADLGHFTSIGPLRAALTQQQLPSLGATPR
jgi:hypothetical protein